jgi:nitroreductase
MPDTPTPDGPPMLPLAGFFRELPPAQMQARATALLEELARRRTVRDFSARPVPRPLIETCLLVAGSAPSGANRQPWHFVAIGKENADLRRRLRGAAEAEERAFYQGRAGQEWLAALAPLGTDWQKPFLETAPWLIAIFGQRYGEGPGGRRAKNYYVPESVGIASGLLIAALHHAGLATLTHTPSPMGFLNRLLGRPDSEKPYLLLVAGYPTPDARVPQAATLRKPLAAIATFL